MTSGPGFNPLSQPNFMPIALPPGQSTPPQQPNPASGPATSSPPNPTETALALSLAATGFKFAEGPTGQTQDQWIDAMRTSANPMARAQFDALTMLAGGRGDNVAIKQVLDRYYALFSAKTASDVAAADKGMINQIATALGGLDPINKLMDVAQPAIANMVRGTGIGQTEWGASLQKILDTPGTISSYRTGFNEGIMEGGKALVVDIATMAAKTAQYAADHSVAGAGGDAIRSLFGTLPAGLDAITPSLARGLQTDKAIIDTGQKIGAYLANRTPAQVGADVAGVINKQWDSLKASHAEAVRQGPQAEARWWGNVTGRITFEVAGTFIPVAGQAGKANTLAKGGGMIADGARTVDKLSDGARVIDKAVDGKRAELVENASRANDRKSMNDAGGKAPPPPPPPPPIYSLNIIAASRRTGIPPEKLQAIVDIPKPKNVGDRLRPDPSSYMSQRQIAAHLQKFDEGIIRFTSRKSFEEYGTLGPEGGFVMPAKDFQSLMDTAKGDLGIVEKKLGLDPGYLSQGDTMVVFMERSEAENLRIPSGNERGVHEKLWMPGGFTSGGVPEAVMDFKAGAKFSEVRF